jgi:hypothetical protein
MAHSGIVEMPVEKSLAAMKMPVRQTVRQRPLFAHCRRRGFRPTDGYDLTGRAGCVRPNPIFFAIADLCAE